MPLLPWCCCREQNVMQLWKDYPCGFLTIYRQVIKKGSAKFSYSIIIASTIISFIGFSVFHCMMVDYCSATVVDNPGHFNQIDLTFSWSYFFHFKRINNMEERSI
jgi:hypothetical protein